jgi:excisionase family DNA binding protein
MQNDQLLTTLDASRILNCSSENVRLLARQDKLPAVTTMNGRQRLYKLADVQKLARQREARAHEGKVKD